MGNTITRKDFAEQVATALRREDPRAEYVYDELDNALSSPDRPTLRLEEPYLEANGLAPSLVGQFAQAHAYLHVHPPQQATTWEEAKEVVFTYVRPMSFHAVRGFQAQQGTDLDVAPYGSLTEHLTVCVGTPTKWKTLVAENRDLARWGVSFEAALDAAYGNVERRGFVEWQKSNEYPGVFRSPWDDEYGIARMLSPSWFRNLPLRGDPVVVAPSWKRFLVAGTEDEQGLVNLGLLAKKVSDSEGFLMYRPVRLHADRIEEWLPPTGHRAHNPLKFLRLMNECGDYTQQAQVGRRFFERREEASNIPAPNVCALYGGRELATIATWREGPPCALPKVDYVALKTKVQDLGIVRWADLERVVGGELEPLKLYPPRWLARKFPAPWQVSEMNPMPWGPGPG